MPPNASTLVARPRLNASLDRGMDGFTWVMGPAGGGKTSALASWAAQAGRHVLWYRVDEGDSDPASMFVALRSALSGMPDVSAESLPLLNPEQLPQLPHFTRHFFRALFQVLPAGCCLVFDNCHEPAADSPFFLLFDLMLQERSRGCSVYATSREPLPGMLQRWLTQPQHRLLPWDELRCTEAEARTMSRAWQDADPTDDQLRQADGWPAGLAMILLLKQQDTRIEADPSRNAAHVFSVFAEQAYEALPPACRQVLLATAFARHATPELASTLSDAVGQPGLSVADAGEHLSSLWKKHFFVELAASSFSDGPLYRYHPLLQAYLRVRAQREWPVDAQRQIWQRLGLWHWQRGEHADAMRCLTQAQAWAQAAALFEAQAPVLLASGQFSALTAWVSWFPEGLADEWPAVHYWQGLSLSQVQPAAARQALAKAHHLYLGRDQIEPAILAACAICDTYFMEWGDWREASIWVDALWALCQRQGHSYSSLAVEVRVLSSGASIIFPCPDHALIQHWLPRAKALLATLSDPAARIALARFVIGYLWWTGEPRITRRLVEELAPLVRTKSTSPASAIEMLVWCAIVHCCDANYAGALVLLDEAQAIGDVNGVSLFDFHIHLHRVMGAQAAGDLPAAERSFAQLPAWMGTPGVGPGTRHLMGLTAPGMHLLRGQPREALALARAALSEFSDSGWVFGREFVKSMCAEMHVLNQEYAAARPLLLQTLAFGARMPSPFMSMMSHSMLAICDFAEQHREAGLEHLRCALHIGRDLGFRSLHPWWIPALMAPLMNAALEAGIERDYVATLIAYNRLKPPPEGGCEHWPFPLRVQVLGPFVLHLEGQTLGVKGKAQQRVLALLKALAAFGGRAVAIEKLTDLLWPDAEGDAAKAAFDVTLHRARKLVDVDDALLLTDGKLSFNPEVVGLDLWEVERMVERVDRALQSEALSPNHLRALSQELLAHRCGPLLADEPDQAWLLQARHGWMRRVERRVLTLAQANNRAQETALAQRLCEWLLELDPLAEAAMHSYVKLLLQLGQSQDAERAYRHFEARVIQAQGSVPDTGIPSLFDELRTGGVSIP